MEKKNSTSKINVLDIVKQFDANSKAEFQRSIMCYVNFLLASSAWYRSRSRLSDFLSDCVNDVLDMIDFENQHNNEDKS